MGFDYFLMTVGLARTVDPLIQSSIGLSYDLIPSILFNITLHNFPDKIYLCLVQYTQ